MMTGTFRVPFTSRRAGTAVAAAGVADVWPGSFGAFEQPARRRAQKMARMAHRF
jgi:hypothetical protein